MRARRQMLGVLLTVTIVMFGIHKWGQHEEGQNLRETQQRISRMLSERKLPLNPSFARKSNRSDTPVPILQELQEESDSSEVKKPMFAAA